MLPEIEFISHIDDASLSLVFSGIVAISTVFYAIVTLRLVKQTRLSREFHLEAFMLAYLTCTEISPNLIILVIKNIGNGVAKNIRFRIIKDIDYQNSNSLKSLGIFDRNIMFFPPDAQNRYFLLSMNEDYENAIKDYIEFEITYDDKITKNKSQRFKLEFIDSEGIGKFTPPETYLGMIPYRLERIEKILDRKLKQQG